MSSIALVCDSTSGLSSAYAQQHGIHVVPLYINMDGQNYRDGVDITAAQFYERLPHCATLPTTSQPSVGDFVTAYREAVMGGATEIVSIHISNEISGTVNSARLAKEQTSGAQIEIVDSRCTSAVIVMAVEAGVTARAAGADLAGVVAAAQRVVEQCRILFVVDTLEYLYKGGRIGGAAALVGSLLQFKPLLYFREGKIDVLERVRKTSRATARMVEVMENWFGTSEPVQVIIMHALCPDKVEPLAALLREHLNITHLSGSVLTPVLGTHVGPGTVGICCCPTSAAGTILDEG